MIILVIILIAIIIIETITVISKNKKNVVEDIKKEEEKEEIINGEEKYPYHKKYLLTKNEYYFYQRLNDIISKYKLQVLAKIRLADLIEVNSGLSKSEWGKYFSKIKSKHIDFAIADNMKIIALIELDDNSHQKTERKERDNFVNNALSNAGYKVIRTYGDIQPVQQALYELGFKETSNNNLNSF